MQFDNFPAAGCSTFTPCGWTFPAIVHQVKSTAFGDEGTYMYHSVDSLGPPVSWQFEECPFSQKLCYNRIITAVHKADLFACCSKRMSKYAQVEVPPECFERALN
eukprot:5106021-Karenia_brevis.AAC.1